jgi:putative inorganic carbon (HCO3(-)) transporter
MGIRHVIVLSTVIGLCLLSPLKPAWGLYGYYWFAMMRPDVLSWTGPNRYSLMLAVATLLSNLPVILRNLPLVATNSTLRNLMLFLLVITISVVTAVDPSLCMDRYEQFLRVFVMSLIIPLILTSVDQLRWFVVVVAGSLGLLGAKYGVYGLLAGGAAFRQGYGGMLSDNNTMALAFAMTVPLCWFARLLVPWKLARLGFIAAGLASLAAVVFTHSRGGVLAAGAGLLVITLMERRKMLAMLVLAAASSGIAYLVWDSFSSRMSTLKNPVMEGSARSRIELALAAPRLWLDYPLFGVGFTEANQQKLIFKYVPPEYAVEYAGKVLHNNWLQILVDSGIFAFLIYVWLVFRTLFRCWLEGRKWVKQGDTTKAAIPNAIAASMVTFVVGSTFLSRTSFDLLYVLLCTAAAWLEAQRRVAPPLEALPAAEPPARLSEPPAMVPAEAAPEAARRIGFGRVRESRRRTGVKGAR